MRLNKKIAGKFKIDYEVGLVYFRTCLLIISLISIIFNTYVNPALGAKSFLIFLTAYLTARITESLYYAFSKDQEYQESIMEVDASFPEISGLIFALFVPIGIPLYAVIFSVALAIVIGKLAFGGFSYNIFNIGVLAAVIALISWPTYNVAYLSDGYWLDSLLITAVNDWLGSGFNLPDIINTPVIANANSAYPGYQFITTHTLINQGFIPAIILILPGIYLIFKKVIDYQITLFISLFTFISGVIIYQVFNDFDIAQGLLYGFDALFSTMMLFVAFFVATDPVTSPKSVNGKMLYSLVIVIITMYIREVSNNFEGVLFAVLFANMLVPFINAKSGAIKGISKKVVNVVILILVIGSLYFIGYNHNEEEVDYLHYNTQGVEVVESDNSTDAATSATQ